MCVSGFEERVTGNPVRLPVMLGFGQVVRLVNLRRGSTAVDEADDHNQGNFQPALTLIAKFV